MNHHILIFFWDLDIMKLRWSVIFKWNDFKIHLRSWYLSHRHCKQNLPSSNMHSTLWSLSSTYNIFEPYKPSPCFGIRYVSCHIPMISTVLEITKTRYLCHLKLTDVKTGLISSVISNDVRSFQLSGLQVFDAYSGISGQFKLVYQWWTIIHRGYLIN